MPVALEGLADLFTLLAWGIALSLLYIWRFTVGALILHLADLLDRASVHVLGRTIHFLGPVSAGLRDIDGAIQSTLAEIAHGAERATVYLFHKSLAGIELFGHELWSLGYDFGGALERLVHVTIPHLAHVAVHRVEQQVAQQIRSLVALEHAIVRPLERTLHREAAAWSAGIAVVRNSIAHALPRIGHVERDLSGVKSRLKSVEGKFAALAFAGLVAAALSRLGLRWLRCGNVSKAGRSICHMDASVLESLLADALAAGGTFGLVELAEHMQGVVGESADIIQKFWRAA